MKRERQKIGKSKAHSVLHFIKRALIICVVVILTLIAILISPFVLPSPFPVESLVRSRSNTVRFEKEKFRLFDALYRLEGMEKFAGSHALVTRMIFADYATFIFTNDGMVYALAHSESGVPCAMIESWKWTGDPHDFPHLGKQYPLSGP